MWLLLQVEGAVTRAYSHWTEDLASLPEYQASIQREKDKWEELQGKNIEQQVWTMLPTAVLGFYGMFALDIP